MVLRLFIAKLEINSLPLICIKTNQKKEKKLLKSLCLFHYSSQLGCSLTIVLLFILWRSNFNLNLDKTILLVSILVFSESKNLYKYFTFKTWFRFSVFPTVHKSPRCRRAAHICAKMNTNTQY